MSRDEDRELRCGRCTLLLHPGSAHNRQDDCFEALVREVHDLQEALEVAVTCDGCGDEIGEHCVPCALKRRAIEKAGEIGMGWFTQLQEGLSGGKKRKGREK